jgi:5-deoxy-5-amino-3-dehydroquinate synthase
MMEVTVPLGERSYPVMVGYGAVTAVGDLVPTGARRVAVVTQANVELARAAVQWLQAGGVEVHTLTIGDGEQHKSLATVEALCREFARLGLTRRDAVVGVGGGLVTDVAGFAAACWHRGVAVVHVATTLLAMVDAAIGGKTGVNLPEGKNLVGAFWQPSGVVCDVDALSTLPERELRCGRGEMAKYHFLTGDDLLALPLEHRIARCVAIKAEVVAADEREGGRRALLNYGHTLAHALETVTDHRLAHGEAVAIGLVFAAYLARQLGRIGDDRVAEHVRVVADEYGLQAHLPEGVDLDTALAVMGRDKKAMSGLTFILDGPAGLEVVEGIPEHRVRAALEHFAAMSRP